ncbi:hypothetical protein CERSUDRAFT_67883 [Gelatoporia subvermispora B]|uniref:Methyltransferase domain-containing protein n=1 Tax=Ceriporiopsis subvermispora (strain B) TaxID=914234 RepID=M2R495_CERS8|nr:hypothetical protein CERSUDRAFT_67883 [Gelatoporia subvermispora B]
MSFKATLARHPGYTVLITCGVFATLLFLARGPAYTTTVNALAPSKYARSLAQTLNEEELRYQKVLHDREALVRKWGPTADLVQAFPPRDDFYTLWDFFIPAFQCPHHVERVGTMGDGGKWVCGLERIARQKECVIYSFGINGESSFEAELLQRAPGCQVWGYDFSVKSFGPEIERNTSLRERAHFYPWALGPSNNHGPGSNPPVYTLPTLMDINGHNFIDILKVDIEGAEFASLDKFLEFFGMGHPHSPAGPALPIGQMQIEIHARGGTGHDEFAPFKKWWERLEAAGLRPFWAEPNLVYVNLVRGVRPDLAEYSFMNARGRHALVSEDFH